MLRSGARKIRHNCLALFPSDSLRPAISASPRSARLMPGTYSVLPLTSTAHSAEAGISLRRSKSSLEPSAKLTRIFTGRKKMHLCTDPLSGEFNWKLLTPAACQWRERKIYEFIAQAHGLTPQSHPTWSSTVLAKRSTSSCASSVQSNCVGFPTQPVSSCTPKSVLMIRW